ncbi:MAG: glycosyltransferase [Bacteroidales bacterium]|nr:glycosyltransferase [Bacteroidales bacterium]
MVHYTPDTAFFHNKSRLFEKSVPYYDYFVTTKSFDFEKYPEGKTILVPQGYNPDVHKPYNSFAEKFREVVFIGLYEQYRGKVISKLLNAGIRVTVAGNKWNRFKDLHHPLLEHLGDGLFGEAYARVISSSLFGIGLLSKRFPELHTTRTFEIPACGTALITEKNKETSTFFTDDEVIFFKNIDEISVKIKEYRKKMDSLKTLTEIGRQKVIKGKFSNQEILQKVLWQIEL